jgi:hypothetical protein
MDRSRPPEPKTGLDDTQASPGSSANPRVFPGDVLLALFDDLATWILTIGSLQSAIRWLALTLVLSIFWAVLAMLPGEGVPEPMQPGQVLDQVEYVLCHVRFAVVGPPGEGNEKNFCDRFADPASVNFKPLIFEVPLRRLFRAAIFQHILVLSFAGWLAFTFAARFQSEAFNLQDSTCAEHFILQAAWINPTRTLHIRGREVSPAEDVLPVARIGGPGRVSVHLENAALFERMDGSPHVIGPTVRQSVTLKAFEKLRTVIDLRDQNEVFNVTGRSQDGIRVTAKDVHLVYSVFRSHQEPTYERPYPFQDPQAIENLVYQQGGNVWNIELGAKIRGALLDFFAGHPLNEFLAMVQEPELKKSQEYEYELMRESQRLTGSNEPSVPPPIKKIEGIEYVSRPQITDHFYTRAEESWLAQGMQVDWIGVGTWDFPAQLIHTRHQEAWRITHENMAKNNPAAFNRLRNQQQLGETLRLIQSVPIATYQKIVATPGIASEDAMRALILVYHTQMREALNEYEHAGHELDSELQQQTDPIKATELRELRERLLREASKIYEVVMFLTRFTAKWYSKTPSPETQESPGNPPEGDQSV